MPIFIFIVGVRGSGKTTLLDNYRSSLNPIPILKPSTTREKRGNSDNEYHFVTEWLEEDYLWTIDVDENKYGVNKNEISNVSNNEPCLCVFDPSSIDKINYLRQAYRGRVVTVGLDTISSVNSQRQRVAGDDVRSMSTNEFMNQRRTVQGCDVVFSGDEGVLLDGLVSVIDCIDGKGGILVERQISSLLKANSLLEGAVKSCSTASYDLRLGDDVWCQGRFITLTDQQPTLRIPPYSYAIVSCEEKAKLPSFVSARFDLKNSLFFRGVILSNGPQVDPGYHGALFCMLYNSSDSHVGITRGHQFSTIEFHRTCGLSKGYTDKYQKKYKLSDFIPSDVAVSNGGMILERSQDQMKSLRAEWESFKKSILWAIPIIITIALFLIPLITSQYKESVQAVEDKRQELENKLELVNSLETQLNILLKINGIKVNQIENGKEIDRSSIQRQNP